MLVRATWSHKMRETLLACHELFISNQSVWLFSIPNETCCICSESEMDCQSKITERSEENRRDKFFFYIFQFMDHKHVAGLCVYGKSSVMMMMMICKWVLWTKVKIMAFLIMNWGWACWWYFLFYAESRLKVQQGLDNLSADTFDCLESSVSRTFVNI